ncbi:hypothetical protein [Methylocystis bryophila]|uniref:hypothetical protein n=1 Tax=Methylocystis bryophila TaxID=655015 RepID=UPI00131A1BFA|nr:hypothetical protein [Methylocystis bryophila]BDV37888.1 hypothetical protein DSM21852_11410 [Methylocystis bryophila]
MPLQRIEGEIVRERHGFAFPMRIEGTAQSVQVVVDDDALVVTTSMLADDELRAQLEADLPALEFLAAEKFDHGLATADGAVIISASDVLGFFN